MDAPTLYQYMLTHTTVLADVHNGISEAHHLTQYPEMAIRERYVPRAVALCLTSRQVPFLRRQTRGKFEDLDNFIILDNETYTHMLQRWFAECWTQHKDVRTDL